MKYIVEHISSYITKNSVPEEQQILCVSIMEFINTRNAQTPGLIKCHNLIIPSGILLSCRYRIYIYIDCMLYSIYLYNVGRVPNSHYMKIYQTNTQMPLYNHI